MDDGVVTQGTQAGRVGAIAPGLAGGKQLNMWTWIYITGDRVFRDPDADEDTGLAHAYLLASVTEKPVTVRRRRVIPTHPPIVSEVTIAMVTPPEAMQLEESQ